MKASRHRAKLQARGASQGWLPVAILLLAALCGVLVARWQFPRIDSLRFVELGMAALLIAVAARLLGLARRRGQEADLAGRQLQEKSEAYERTRLALVEVERELGDIFESISDAFYTLDRDWRFVLLNPKAEELMQQPRGELRGKVVWEAFPEVLGTDIEHRLREAAREDRTVQFEVYFPPLRSWFNARVYPHPNGLAVYFQDVGERKRAELALLNAQSLSERAQRMAHLGAWEYDLATSELRWSDETLRIFGMTRAQLARGLPAMLERVHAQDRHALEAAQRKLHAGEADISLEYRVVLPDGEVRRVREIGTQVLDGAGRRIAVAGALQDITERHRAEEALRQLSSRLEASLSLNRLVMDNSLDIICAMDMNGRFSQVSAASLAVWGYPANELIGRDYLDFLHPDDRGPSLRRAAEIRAGKPTLDFQNRFITAAGQVRTMQWSSIWSPQDRLMFAVARDITEAKRAESLEAGQRSILAGVAARRPLKESLEQVTRFYEQAYPGALCSVLLLDPDGVHLRHGAAPSLPGAYNEAIHGVVIGEGVGSCGTSAFRGKRVVVADIARDPLWRDYAALAEEHALRSCWSTPVLSADGRVLATFATYYDAVREPTPSELTAIDAMSSITALAVEQDLAYRALADARDVAENNSRQLRRLSEAAMAVNRKLGDDGLYQYLVDQLRETLGSHQALMSLNLDAGYAQHISAISLSEKYRQWRHYDTPSDGSGIYALVCESNRPMRLSQAELVAHPRWRGFGAHAADHPPMAGWLAVPLISSDGRNLGLMQLSDKIRGEFSEDDEVVAVQFAQMASIAVERAALMETLAVRDRFFDQSLEVFVIFDPDRLRWVQVNPMLEKITGYTAEELCSREFFEFLHPEDRAANTLRARHLREGLPVSPSIVNRYVCRDGRVRSLEWVSVRGPDGMVYGVGRDVTERLQAEAALRQSLAELGNRNRELQDFAFIASHDLQEPLRKIRAFSDRLQQRYADQLAPEARDYLDRASQAAARMQILIDDLLAYSRVARGNAFEPVELGAVMASVLDDLEARLESSGGRVEAGPLPQIRGDASQLRQAFQNLLSNALKFRSPDRPPVVRVSATSISVDGVPAWELRFDDNGIGFDPKYADRIFGPFQRLHGRQDYEGTGIGLAIVRRIAERHGGHVTAVGRPGAGASFRLVLPEQPPASNDSTSLAPMHPVTGTGME